MTRSTVDPSHSGIPMGGTPVPHYLVIADQVRLPVLARDPGAAAAEALAMLDAAVDVRAVRRLEVWALAWPDPVHVAVEPHGPGVAGPIRR